MSEEGAEREAAVASEGPGETGNGSNDTDTADEANNDDGALHGGGRFDGTGGLVEDLDDGVAGVGHQSGCVIPDAEEEDEDESECQRPVDGDGLDQHPRNHDRGVPDLLAHVDGAIEAWRG